MAQTDDGRILRGLIVEESAESLTLVEANGTEHQLNKSSLEILKQASQSIMPEHLLQAMTPREAADLLEYLKSPPASVTE